MYSAGYTAIVLRDQKGASNVGCGSEGRRNHRVSAESSAGLQEGLIFFFAANASAAWEAHAIPALLGFPHY